MRVLFAGKVDNCPVDWLWGKFHSGSGGKDNVAVLRQTKETFRQRQMV